MHQPERRAAWSPEYTAYHDAVVAACVEMFTSNRIRPQKCGITADEEVRQFFACECDYFDEFKEGLSATECAEAQYDALT